MRFVAFFALFMACIFFGASTAQAIDKRLTANPKAYTDCKSSDCIPGQKMLDSPTDMREHKKNQAIIKERQDRRDRRAAAKEKNQAERATMQEKLNNKGANADNKETKDKISSLNSKEDKKDNVIKRIKEEDYIKRNQMQCAAGYGACRE